MKIDDVVYTVFSDVFESKLMKELCHYGILKNVEPDEMLLEIRRSIKFIPFVASGIVKVMRRDGKGNGIFLNYLTTQQTSAIAVTYAMENKKSEIRLKAQTEVSYIAVPVKVVESWFEKYPSWRSYYFSLNCKQTSFLIEKINDIAFTSLEHRLIKYLEYTGVVNKNNIINRKHFDIARDLKVSREAISRTLKKLEKEDIVSLGRNRIILN